MRIGAKVVFEDEEFIILDVSSDDVEGRKLVALTLTKEDKSDKRTD